jgi:MoaA/NifB/PqqE/SkfB family radical SAM enzyme
MENEIIRTLKGTPKHLSKTGSLDSFTYLMMNLPYECNFRCKKCFNLVDGRPRKYDKLISLEKRIDLIEQAKEIGGKVVVFAGEGEPNLNKDINEMVEYTNKSNMIPIIYSNGSTLTKERIEFYKKNNSSIIFALDSIKENVFSMKSFEKGIFPKTIINMTRTIDSFKKIAYREDNLEVLSVAVNSTVNDLNLNEIKTLKSFWKEDAYYICNPVAKFGNAINNWGVLRGELKDEIIYAVAKENSETGGPLTLDKEGLCGYSAYGISISPGGDYMTCAYTNQTDGFFGNVGEIKLKEAWENKHEKEFLHYKKFGNVPCLIRDDSFEKYLEQLKK